MFNKEKLMKKLKVPYHKNVSFAKEVAKKGPDVMRDPEIVEIIANNFAYDYAKSVKELRMTPGKSDWSYEGYNELVAGSRELCMGAILNGVSFYRIKDLFPAIDFEHDLELCSKFVLFNLKNIENVPCKKEDIKDAIFESLKNPFSELKELSQETIAWINETFTDEELAKIFASNPCGCMRLDYTSGGYDYYTNEKYKEKTFITRCYIKPDVITSDVLDKAFEVVKKSNHFYINQSPSRFLNQLKYYSAFHEDDLFGRLSRKTVLSIPTIRHHAHEAVEAYFAPVKKSMDDNDGKGWVISDKEFLLKWIANCSSNEAILKASVDLRYDEDVIRAAIDADKQHSQLKNVEFLLNKKAIKMDFPTAIYLVAHTFDKDFNNSSKLKEIVELSDSLVKEEVGEVCKYAFAIDKSCIEGIPKEMLVELFESTFVNKKEGIRNSSDWKERFEASFDKDSFICGKATLTKEKEEEVLKVTLLEEEDEENKSLE